MKMLLFLLTLTMCGAKVLSQNPDTYQPSIVYKQNKVKARIMTYKYSKHDSKSADMFDHEGRITDHVEFDTTGTTIVWRVKYEYDTSNWYKKEITYDYHHFDTATKNYTFSSTPEIIIASLEYDSVNQRFKKTRINAKGLKIYETETDFQTLSQMEVWNYPDSSKEVCASIYEVMWIEKKHVEVYHSPKGEIDSVEFTAKNEFDKAGRIVSRKVKTDTPDYFPKTHRVYFKDCRYEYSANGLLVKKEFDKSSDKTDVRVTQVFDYKFW